MDDARRKSEASALQAVTPSAHVAPKPDERSAERDAKRFALVTR